jgi:hypothetical protein
MLRVNVTRNRGTLCDRCGRPGIVLNSSEEVWAPLHMFHSASKIREGEVVLSRPRTPPHSRHQKELVTDRRKDALRDALALNGTMGRSAFRQVPASPQTVCQRRLE